MKLHILGSGSCLVAQERNSSGYLIETNSSLIMVDTGTGTTKMMREKGFSTDEIDAVVNTHRHPDHVSDLIPIIQDKVVRSFEQDEPDIQLYGPEEHIKYLEDRMHHEMRENWAEFDENFGFKLEVKEVEKTSEIADLKINSFRAEHGPKDFNCVSLEFSIDGKTVFFTGDTDYFEGLADNASEADVVVADCSKPDELKSKGHMTPTECARVARDSGAEILVLSHLYPEAEETRIKETASKTFGGKIIVAEDLMTLEL